MGIGVSVFLIAIGAILTFAVEVSTQGFNLDIVGVILMISGAIGLLWSLMVSEWVGYGRRDSTVVEDRGHTHTRV